MATLLEEDEVLGIAQNSYEWDLGGCGGREDVNHEHSQDLTASTSRREINNNSLGSNDGTLVPATNLEAFLFIHVCSDHVQFS